MSRKTHEPTGHEAYCLANAAEFSAARGRGATRTIKTFPTQAEAETFAASFGDGRTMIYAITPDGHSAHIRNA